MVNKVVLYLGFGVKPVGRKIHSYRLGEFSLGSRLLEGVELIEVDDDCYNEFVTICRKESLCHRVGALAHRRDLSNGYISLHAVYNIFLDEVTVSEFDEHHSGCGSVALSDDLGSFTFDNGKQFIEYDSRNKGGRSGSED